MTLYLVIPTLAARALPAWDTAEFQTVGPVLGTAHPTGYPAYVILGWFASIVFQPFGESGLHDEPAAGPRGVAVAGTAGGWSSS